jgi:biopolymer transport protein ExbB/TolQ
MDQVATRSRETGLSCGSYVHEESHAPAPHGKSRAAMIWGVGSTVLSVLGFLAWGLFEQYNSSLAELRADLKHFNEASSTFVKKDSMTRAREQYKTQFAEMQSMSASNKQLDAELKASERAREAMVQELIRIRERLAFVEGRQSAAPAKEEPPVTARRMSREE